MIPPGFLQDLLSRIDIVEVVGRHVELKRGGANFMGLCPFHAEKSPSFSVNPAKQFYYCFGCGAGGDAVRFLTEHLGLSFIEAVRDLAQGAGLKVPEEQVSPEERERRSTLRERRKTLNEVLTQAADFYRGQLKASPRAVNYLRQRGLTGQIAARFGLGYAPPGWRTLAGVFPRYDDPLLEEAGLVRLRESASLAQSPAPIADDSPEQAATDHAAATSQAPATAGEGSRYDWFRDRVMFPIRAVSGEVIGFGGRVLDDAKPKYINSPETPVFSKGRELYGLFEARQTLRDKGYALVVEGYMDVVALAQSGFANTVATLGTACTAEHVQKLFRFTDAIVFSFDGDSAGRRAAGRALEAALPHATDLRSVRFLFLPPEHDPDSYVREFGPAAFEQQVAQAVPLSRQLIEHAADGADLSSAEGRARLLAQARPLWTLLPDGALKRQMLPELARSGALTVEDLTSLWGQASATATSAAASGRAAQAGRGTRFTRALGSSGRRAPAASADLALRLLLRHSDWWEKISAEDQQMLHELGGAHGQAVAWLEQQMNEHGPQTWATLAKALSEQDFADEAQAWVQAALADEEQSMADLRRVMHRLWRARLEAEVQALIAHGSADAQGSPDREILAEISRLNEQIRRHRAGETAAPGP